MNQRPLRLRWGNRIFFLLLCLAAFPGTLPGQCLSSVNPVGGSDNLLVLEKKSLRIISLYKFGQGRQYYQGSQPSDFNLITRAYYNYLSLIAGYGITDRVTIEIESGYFINKTQDYNVDQGYSLTGRGLSNFALLARSGIFSDQSQRFYITGGAGIKIPSRRKLQQVNHVKLPVEVQPSLGAWGAVLNTSMVKENSFSGMRYFFTSRMEAYLANIDGYRPGTAIFSSVFISKHLMYPWVKGDWTAILQLKNEFRGYDRIDKHRKSSSGSIIFYLVPQLNFTVKEKWNISAMTDIPVYQYFNGTQLGAATGISVIISGVFPG